MERTRDRLKEERLLDRCELYCIGHEHIAETIEQPVRCVVFNLGWLPGGNKSITTHWETTKIAIEASLSLLQPMGILTVCAYPGHEAGNEERRKLKELFSSLKPQEYNVLHQKFLNAGEDAPECFIIQRQDHP